MRALLLNYWLLYWGLSDNQDVAVLLQIIWHLYMRRMVNSMVETGLMAEDPCACCQLTGSLVVVTRTHWHRQQRQYSEKIHLSLRSLSPSIGAQATQNLSHSHDVIISKNELRLPARYLYTGCPSIDSFPVWRRMVWERDYCHCITLRHRTNYCVSCPRQSSRHSNNVLWPQLVWRDL